ncbi:uncharacterized protein LOC117169883 [Belonocnema kinseyi]|uniref:uncharacterized protein LOC117169883 n=1 Tax=Belonocnema kinseyi TaxID=2817044 RepID=UPI00143DBA82|nr:uncharacterized protein LOC117169883 [Belonocnema kinseyi]
MQLRGFSDASQNAHGTWFYYLRTLNEQGYFSVLLCSKSRVAPVKTISIPRLELCAALLLSKLYKNDIKSLKIKFGKVVFWSNFTIVLNWINKTPYKLKTFETNRVAEIQGITEAADWRHVPTKDNPVDFISRGQLPMDVLNNRVWTNGPLSEFVLNTTHSFHCFLFSFLKQITQPKAS